jgi:hypothetical protein
MGIIIQTKEKILWEPSQFVGRVFVAQIHALEEVYGYRSGVSHIVADEVEIDEGNLDRFLDDILQDLALTTNNVAYSMITGCLAIAIALNFKANGKLPEVPEKSHARLDNILIQAHTILGPLDSDGPDYGQPPR